MATQTIAGYVSLRDGGEKRVGDIRVGKTETGWYRVLIEDVEDLIALTLWLDEDGARDLYEALERAMTQQIGGDDVPRG